MSDRGSRPASSAARLRLGCIAGVVGLTLTVACNVGSRPKELPFEAVPDTPVWAPPLADSPLEGGRLVESGSTRVGLVFRTRCDSRVPRPFLKRVTLDGKRVTLHVQVPIQPVPEGSVLGCSAEGLPPSYALIDPPDGPARLLRASVLLIEDEVP